mgnify:CR=1 FL=1
MPELSKRLWLYIIAISASGITLLVYWTYTIPLSWGIVIGFLFWAVLDIMAESAPVALPQGGFVTLGFPIIYASLLIYGPGISSWVVICGTVIEAKRRGRKRWYGVLSVSYTHLTLPTICSV